MAIWSDSMQQTFEYYIVDPNTWMDVKPIRTVKSCEIKRDIDTDTLGSATFDIDETIGECYIRAYLVIVQNGIVERHALGTFLVQTPSMSFDGKTTSISLDAYTPLLELKEGMPPIGYYLSGETKDLNIMDMVYTLTREHARAPVIKPTCDKVLYYNFVADTSDTWLSFLKDLMIDAKYTFVLDELGRILFAPKQDTAALHPIWTYTDDNSSILYPDLNLSHDLYDIPNVVEVVYSNGGDSFYAKVVNDDPNSPISTVKRGREITHRVTDPELISDPILQPFYYKVTKNSYYKAIDNELIPPEAVSHYTITATNKVTSNGEDVYKATHNTSKVTSFVYKVENEDSTISYYEAKYIEEYIRQNEKINFAENCVKIKVVDEEGNDTKTVLNEIVWCTYPEDDVTKAEYYCEVLESYQVKEYAVQLLKELSTIEYSISYTHGYCPVRIGDCVMLNYKQAGLNNVKAKVISQSIKCESGCPVTEKAVFTARLWG